MTNSRAFIHKFRLKILLLGPAMEETMSRTVQSFVDEIAAKADVDPSAAETAVGTILFVIQREGNATKVDELFDQLPGAAELAQKHQVVAGSGGGILGTLSGVADKVVGGDGHFGCSLGADRGHKSYDAPNQEHRYGASCLSQGEC